TGIRRHAARARGRRHARRSSVATHHTDRDGHRPCHGLLPACARAGAVTREDGGATLARPVILARIWQAVCAGVTTCSREYSGCIPRRPVLMATGDRADDYRGESMETSGWVDWPDYRIDVQRIRNRVRVSVGDRLLADSTRALLVAEQNHGIVLYLPRS